MAKLYFRYGAMGSSKTANALMVKYNYEEKGQTPVLLKPRTDTRDGERIIRSRIGLKDKCRFVDEFLEEMKSEGSGVQKALKEKKLAAVIVDEAQFVSAKEVDLLSDIVDFYDIPVLCYGLRTDFTSHLFEGSKRLMEIADIIEEVPTVCWCGRRAHYNTRIKDGKVVRTGEQIMIGGNESYVSLCRKHFKEGRIEK
jgi:thymidine kinase